MPQPEKVLDPTQSPEAWFGHELRLRRKAAGFSTAGPFARKVQVSVDVLLKIEKGIYRCPEDLPPRLDAALGSDGLFTRAWGMVFGDADKHGRDADKRRPLPGEGSAPQPQGRMLEKGAPSSSTRSPDSVHRRRFLTISSGLLALAPLDLSALLSPATQLTIPDKISSKEIRQLQEIAAGLHSWDNTHGGGGLVGHLATNSMQWAIGLLSADCPPSLRPDFLGAVARLGLVAGGSQFDVYRHDEARLAFKVAVECAEEGQHWHLRAKGYSFLARQAIWTGDADDGLTNAEKGLVRQDRLTASERAMLHTARARAFGKLRNVQETIAAVGAADDAFAQRRPEDDPPWMAYYDEAQHNGDTAHALWDLAVGIDEYDPTQAGHRFQAAVRGHGPQFLRSKAMSCTKLASLVMRRGDPREAAAIGHRALELGGDLTSLRAADDLRQLAQFAGRHSKIPDAAHLQEAITATLRP
ncbi:helix-turn-helix domain-containing protein [Streptomyces sp. NRRL F-5650]|uniref:helix-turn-helix domain-containing protein n=1 Tax=Streptomyces sp. NRRL F-5650 TaxID=1463868 RepID=UPI001F164203|nr:helix-turn-helix transcriptional regulator [Streptomyces sp. NRRL F-5650]